MQLPSSTRINTLRIRGPANARHQITRRLNEADWPEPADQSWVLVREIRAQGPLNSLPDTLLSEARRWVQDGRDGSNLVRFASLDELLCALLRDLALGVSDQHWYWRSWSHLWPLPRGTAIALLLSENSLQINAVCARLASRQALGLVWQALDEQGAVSLLKILTRETGIPLEPASHSEHPLPPDLPVLRLPATTLQRWQPVLAEWAHSDPRHWLAVVLVALESAPLQLTQAPDITLSQIRRQLATSIHTAGSRRPATDQHQEEATGNPKIWFTGPLHTPAIAAGRTSPLAAARASPTAASMDSIGPRQTSISRRAKPGNRTEQGSQQTSPDAESENETSIGQETAGDSQKRPLQRVRPEPAPPHLMTPGHDPEFDQIHTGLGGTLYLLNFLSRDPVQEIMTSHWDQLPNGWAWLYQLARELAFDAADPLADFLALQMGLESPHELEALAPLPQRQTLLQLADQWYGREELWHPSLLRMPAELHYTPSHIDLHASDQAIRMEVRLAGLDINPGWLPWLGRVVTFHYGKQPS